MEKVKRRDQAALAELRRACWVTEVQQAQAHEAAHDATTLGTQVSANMAGISPTERRGTQASVRTRPLQDARG